MRGSYNLKFSKFSLQVLWQSTVKNKNFNERAKLVYHVLAFNYGIFERLQHTQNIHGGGDMGLPSQFTIHLTNIKRIQGNLIMVFTSCWKIKDDLHRLGIKRESVAVEENNVASAFLLLFLSLTSFVPFSVFSPSFSRFSSIQCSFSSVFSSFFSLIFSPCALCFLYFFLL